MRRSTVSRLRLTGLLLEHRNLTIDEFRDMRVQSSLDRALWYQEILGV